LQNFIKNNLYKVLRRSAWDRDETWNLRDRDRDSKKWVSRPRPSLETPWLLQALMNLGSFQKRISKNVNMQTLTLKLYF